MAGSEDWTAKNVYFLTLMTLGYIVGEIAHFLINTSSRAVARDIGYGDQGCYKNASFSGSSNFTCLKMQDEDNCTVHPECEWNYTGIGLDYQILSGPAFTAVFTIFALITGIISDNIRDSRFGRHRLMAIGILVFSVCCLLMGFSTAYWQLVILRMGIAAGEAVCRPTSGSLIADAFSPTSRGIANGIFSWGIYYGYGLAFVIGIYLTAADFMGYGWRASYVVSAIPGLLIAVLLATTVSEPKANSMLGVSSEEENCEEISEEEKEVARESQQLSRREKIKTFLKALFKAFCQPAMIMLLLSASIRQMAGLCWAFNTGPYFQNYHPDFQSLGFWLLGCSVGGGSFGVFFGGFFSDLLVRTLGLHSRLWVLAASMVLAVPFSSLVLYLEPPYALVSLLVYYFFAETWFAILFTVIVEVCSPEVRSSCIAVFLFLMNNVGGNLPVVVDPVSKLIGYREAIYVFWPGGVGLSGLLFFTTSIILRMRHNPGRAGS